MDPQFQELAAQISNDVTDRVTASITEVVNARVIEAVKAAEERLAHQAQVNAKALNAAFTGAERRLFEQARVNVEAVKEQARLAAEGYAATLDAIHGRLDRIEAKIDSKFSVHDAVLKNHNNRITALERDRT
jgi:hypothetical protein